MIMKTLPALWFGCVRNLLHNLPAIAGNIGYFIAAHFAVWI